MSRTFLFFFFNDTATTEIYTLSLHDALPISKSESGPPGQYTQTFPVTAICGHLCGLHITATTAIPEAVLTGLALRSEEHTSELQSQSNLVCRLLLEKKKTR